MTPAPDPLDATLEALERATPAQPDSVQHEVWRRIAHGEQTTAAATGPWWQRIEAAFSRPAFAAAFIAASLLLGLFLAEMRLTRVQTERTAALERSYLRLIDPLFKSTDLIAGDQPPTQRP